MKTGKEGEKDLSEAGCWVLPVIGERVVKPVGSEDTSVDVLR
jgi:hypothetical protein